MGKKLKDKKPSGQGGVSERKDGCFDAYLTIHTLDGPKVARTTKRTEQDAYRWLNKLRHDHDEGQIPNFAASKVTVGEYLDGWLEAIQGTVSRHTWRDYVGKVRLHLKPSLGRIKLKDLTAAHLQTLYARLSTKLSPRSVGYVHFTISKALNQAEAWDLVKKNVARHAPEEESLRKNDSNSRGSAALL